MFLKSAEDSLGVVLAAIINTRPNLTPTQAAQLAVEYVSELNRVAVDVRNQTSSYNRPVLDEPTEYKL